MVSVAASVKGPNCLVRINGETVLEYDRMDNLEAGADRIAGAPIGKWTQFKKIRIRRL